MSSRLPVRLPDLIIGVACVLLLVGLAWFALSHNRHASRAGGAVPAQLRSIHQALLIYGVDNGGFLPGLSADGTLLTNDPAARYEMLLEGQYLGNDDLLSPLDADESVDYSYAILDIASPGLRRGAWTTEPLPDAPVLAERPGRKPWLGAWAGWVMYHRATLGPFSEPMRYAESPRVAASYAVSGPITGEDELFQAEGADDAYLIVDEP